MKHDFLVVGTGLFGATFAHLARRAGMSVLAVDKRPETGGNVRCEEIEGITVHKYGAHIFHTADREVWDFVTSLTPFHPYIHSPKAVSNGKVYNLPFNMHTFRQLWGTETPAEAESVIEAQTREARERLGGREPANLEEQALAMVGRDIYETLVKGYSEKQWGRECRELPPFLIRRLPLRFRYDNNYFDDPFQGIPVRGYNALIDALLEGVEVRLQTDFLRHRELAMEAEKTVYTGPLDAYFDYRLGRLEYRSLRWETEVLDTPDAQGCAVLNSMDPADPFTRTVEHRHFSPEVPASGKTVLSREYPLEWQPGREPFYPINDERNEKMARAYRELARREPDVIFGGRLGQYRYYDMAPAIRAAMDAFRSL